MPLQYGKNSILAFHAALANVWGTEYVADTLVDMFGGVMGVAPENALYQGPSPWQQTDYDGNIKPPPADYTGAFSFQGMEKLLACCFGKSPGAGTVTDTSAYKLVYDFPADSNNNVVMTLAQFDGLAAGTTRAAQSAKINQFSLSVPKSGTAKFDIKMIANKVIKDSAINTEATLTALTAFNANVYRSKLQLHHFATGATQSGYVRIRRAGPTATAAAAYQVGTTYGKYAYATSGGFTWMSKVAGNIGQTVTENAYWTKISDVALTSADDIYPNAIKIDANWGMNGTNGPARSIREPHANGTPKIKFDLDFDADEGSNVDPNNVQKGMKDDMAWRQDGISFDYKAELFAETSLIIGAVSQKQSLKIELPRLSLTQADGKLSGPGPIKGKMTAEVMKAFADPAGMTTNVYQTPMRWTLYSQLSTNPLA